MRYKELFLYVCIFESHLVRLADELFPTRYNPMVTKGMNIRNQSDAIPWFRGGSEVISSL